MKILKFKNKQQFRYNKKVIIKDLILLLSVGIHKFEKLKKQNVRFNIRFKIWISSNFNIEFYFLFF